MTYKYTIFSLLLLAVVSFLTMKTFFSYHSEPLIKDQMKALPDGIMEDVKALVMNKQGKPEMKIDTPKMIHFEANDTTDLITPKLTLYRKSPNPWYITAQFAKATDGIENVDFWNNVVIHHAADEKNPATVIKTSTLNVHPNKKTAETQDFITMIQPQMTIKAQGMKANMKTGDIKLLSQARGVYVPH